MLGRKQAVTIFRRYASQNGVISHDKTLLPPLMLYRRILRAHKLLPPMQREMGDNYVKSEFELHKSIDNPLHIVGFLASWQDYLYQVTDGKWKEGTLSPAVLEKMSPEQVAQLYELMKETERVTKGETPKEE
ncbi:hypothetical protein RNJ44_00881 [Nakaseomyces bracarensis]|uniref:Succinate dehydrogenase assembly factor 3 n=1 Tax=Nakaseomyces bracarensis TaxID=273131 RepID=A0ABR4NQB3_9SACH